MKVWANIELSLSQGGVTNDEWDRTVCNINRLPKYWIAKFLAEVDTSALKITAAVLKKVDDADLYSIPRIFCYVLQLAESTPLPKCMRNSKLLCWKVFERRLTQCGNLLRNFAKDHISAETGKVDWKTACPFQFQWNEHGGAETVTYLRKVVKAIDVAITKDYEMVNPWDVCNAQVRKKPSTMSCIDFWEPSEEGPWQLVDRKGKKLEEFAAEVAAEIQQSKATLNPEARALDESEFVGSAVKEARKERLKAAQAKASASAKRKRTLAFESEGDGE